MRTATRQLSQLDAFFVAYQERAGISMQLGVEVDLDGRVQREYIERALHALVREWPQLGQTLRRRVLGLRWAGTPDVARMIAGADDDGAVLAQWRNRELDPFTEPPFQVLVIRGATSDSLAFRAHHSVADGQSFYACVVATLEMIGAAAAGQSNLTADVARASDGGEADLLSPSRALRQGKLGSMFRYARWLVGESRAGRSTKLAIRDDAAGDVSVASRAFAGETRERIWQAARDAKVTPAIFVCAAWVRAIGRWNDAAGDRANSLVSLELPISVRRGADRTSAVGNFISPLVLFADANDSLDAVATNLRGQLRTGIRERSYLAMPLFTAAGRYVPWPLFRRMAANTTWSGFATSHYTWVDTIADAHTAISSRSGGALGVTDQRVYTPVCRHMGAALLAMPWADSLQLFLTHRLNAISNSDASALLDLVSDEIGAR
jgi:hypothetical protein